MGKTKGSAVIAAVKLLRSRRPEAQELLPAPLLHYLDERIVVAAWYPEEDLLALIRACAGVFPARGESIFESMGAAGARNHMEGIYADLMGREPSARAHALWRTQHDTGELRVAHAAPTSVTYELSDWTLQAADYCRLLGGYLAEIHRIAGAPDPTFLHPACRASGARSCVWLVRWS
ncbi:MAG TPA: hypothetical protein VMR31_11970 [Myxococcota bacterium]|nr:hypothetical protein [Myxococcota bacterium]